MDENNEIASENESSPARWDGLGRETWIPLGIAGLGVVTAAAAQYFAPDFDHQNANIVTLVALAATTISLLIIAHNHLRHVHRALVPVSVLVVLCLLVLLFRFDGFSGEMWPLVQWRFGGTAALPLAEVEEPTEATVQAAAPSTELDSPQFLGPNRNGVYQERLFGVPNTQAEVTVLWDQGIGSGWSSFAVAGGLAVTQEQRDQSECLTAYRVADGSLVWMQSHPGLHSNPLGGEGPRSTPTIDKENVYALSATGYVWCTSLDAGEIVWTADLNAIAGWSQAEFEQVAPWGHASSPLLVDGLCVLSFGAAESFAGGPGLIALDAKSGKVVWTAGSDQLSYASPMLMTLAGQRQIVSVNEMTVSGHEIADGRELWSFPWPGSTNTGANCASAVAVGDDRVLVGKGYGGGSAVYRISKSPDGEFSAEEQWSSSRVMKTKFNHACVVGEIGYGLSNGALQAADLTTGAQLWLQPRSERAGQGQAILVGDVLIVQTEAGEIQFVRADPDEYQKIGGLKGLDSKTWNIPTLAGRHLLVRNDRRSICFLLPLIDPNTVPDR